MAEERVNELEQRSIKIFQSAKQREKQLKMKKKTKRNMIENEQNLGTCWTRTKGPTLPS